MKVYLAAGFSRKDEIADKSQDLWGIGVDTTSSWPWETVGNKTTLDQVDDVYKRTHARRDVNEIKAADALVLFTQDPTVPFVRGGRMHEAGLAHGLGKKVIVCGPRENIFHWLPEIEVYATWDEVKERLSWLEKKERFPGLGATEINVD